MLERSYFCCATASEIMNNIPSVNVDQDGKLSLRGNENVRVLIDGRPSNIEASIVKTNSIGIYQKMNYYQSKCQIQKECLELLILSYIKTLPMGLMQASILV
jgi:hypothetical protein